MERAGVEQNSWPLRSVAHSLSSAGAAGRQRLDRLSESAEGDLKSAIRYWREGWFVDKNGIRFPPLPQSADLPKQVPAIEAQQR